MNASKSISGRVLVAGCGFIVTGAGWALFGFVEQIDGAATVAAVYFVLSVLCAVAGIGILARQRLAAYVAFFVGGIGLVVAGVEVQLVLVTTNIVTLLLLFLARSDIIARNGANP